MLAKLISGVVDFAARKGSQKMRRRIGKRRPSCARRTEAESCSFDIWAIEASPGKGPQLRLHKDAYQS
jgi:hypothetical protein